MTARAQDLIFRVALDGSRPAVLSLLGLLMAAAWSMSFVAGGASVLPPHFFYVPIVLAGIRFGVVGAVITAAIAGLVGGPVLPADVSAGAAQALPDWIARATYFIVIGTVITVLMRVAVESARRDHETLARKLELQEALADRQFELHYQPIIEVETGDVVGAEALIRWHHPTRGQVNPAEFISFVEEHGMADLLGEWVLVTAFDQLLAWERSGMPELASLEVAVNVSRRQFNEDALLLQTLDRLLGPEPARAARLLLEVTETALADSAATLVDQLMAIRLLGVRIAIDDFGTGNSSVMTLRDLPFDFIKIDQTFVSGVDGNPANRAIVNNIAELGRKLQKLTIGEGVETPNQHEVLAELGVDFVQGYCFAPAMPLADFETWAVDHHQRVTANRGPTGPRASQNLSAKRRG